MKGQVLSIVHVIHHLVIGGMENGVVNLVNNLPREKFRHTVVCIEDYSDFAGRIERDDVDVIALHRSRIGTWRLRWRLFRLFRRLRPHIVHSRNLSGLDALLPARLAGSRTLHSEHGFDVDNLRGAATKPIVLRRLHAPLVDLYVCVSQDLRRLMIEQWGIPKGKIRNICNGVDTSVFSMPATCNEERPYPDARMKDRFVIGTVGRIRPIKDQATLLRAFAYVLERRPELRARTFLVVVGDGPLLESLTRLAESLNISALCWFAGARHDVAAIMQSFDLFVLPSLNEGISNTLLEAMATGLPVVATAVGGNLELVDEGNVGVTFTPGDVSGLGAIIESYATNPALCEQHGAAARMRVIHHFSLQAMVSKYQDVYESLRG